MDDKPLNEKRPGVTYAEEVYENLRASNVIKSHARAIAYLFGDTEDKNRALDAAEHLKAIYQSHPNDPESRAEHDRELQEIGKLPAAQVIEFFPEILGKTSTQDNWKFEMLFYQGLSIHMMAWARNRASVAAIKALGHAKMEPRAQLSKATYAMVAKLCKENVIPVSNPVYAWLLCEASFHRTIVRNTEKGIKQDHEKLKLIAKSMEIGLPTFTDLVDGKEAYEHFDGIVRAAAGELAQKDERFRRSQYARFTRAFRAWNEEVERISARIRPGPQIGATYRPRIRTHSR